MTDYTKREFQDEAADLYGDDIAKIIRTAAALHAVLTEYGPPSAWVCEQWAVILGHALNPPEEPATVRDPDMADDAAIAALEEEGTDYVEQP